MEWLQLPVAYAAGAAGCVSMAKLLRLIGPRPQGSVAPRNTLFVNGEQDKVLERIEELAVANRERRRDCRKVAEDLTTEARERRAEDEDIRGILEQLATRMDVRGI